MTPNINFAINALVAALRREAPDQIVTFRLFVNCEESEVTTTARTPDQLNASGISMRNLRGDFIKPISVCTL